MPDTTLVTGLHTPITNVVPTESTVVVPILSPGSVGFGDEMKVEDDALVEAIEGAEFEGVLEVAVDNDTGTCSRSARPPSS